MTERLNNNTESRKKIKAIKRGGGREIDFNIKLLSVTIFSWSNTVRVKRYSYPLCHVN